MRGVETKLAEAWRRGDRHGDKYTGPRGHSANLEAGRSFLWGSWRLCTPFPPHVYAPLIMTKIYKI